VGKKDVLLETPWAELIFLVIIYFVVKIMWGDGQKKGDPLLEA
jgi:hypothetical protein